MMKVKDDARQEDALVGCGSSGVTTWFIWMPGRLRLEFPDTLETTTDNFCCLHLTITRGLIEGLVKIQSTKINN